MSRIREIEITEIRGTVSVVNSSTGLLAAGESFTGEWEETKDFATIKVNVTSDQDAAAGGLCFQQSPDQTIIFDKPYEYSAADKGLFTPNPVARYFRIVYTNGTTPQTLFSLQTIYSSVYSKPTSRRLGDFVTGNDNAELVKSVIAFGNDVDDSHENVGVQSPFPVDGDSVYEKDVWVDESEIGDFSGSVVDIFNNLNSVIVDSTANNPKELLVHFNRTVVSNVIGLGAASGDFSNTEIQIVNSGGVFTTVIDESTDSTKYTSRTFNLPTTVYFNAVKFIFHTADTVTVSNSFISKSRGVVSRVHGPNGLEYSQDEITGDRTVVEHAHSEIHEGRNFTAWENSGNVTSLILAFRVENQARVPHMTMKWKTEETATVTWYRGATWTTGTGADFAPINSNETSAKTSILQGDASGAFVSDNVVVNPTGLATGSATVIFEESVWSTNQSPSGAGTGQRTEKNLLPGETYVVEIVCAAGGAWAFLDWYEHIPLVSV